MLRLLILLFSFVTIDVHAARRITSCDKAPGLAAYQEQFPDYITSDAATKRAKLITPPTLNGARLSRFGGGLTCIVLRVDRTGQVLDAVVTYPIGLLLLTIERENILAMRYAPAEFEGQPRESFVTLIVSSN